jgi:CIC family chloride channel protein
MGDDVLLSFTITGAFNMRNIPWYLLLGAITGLVSVYFTRFTLFIESRYKEIRNIYVRLLAGGLVVGILVFLFPAFYGEGYDAIMSLLEGDSESLFGARFFQGLEADTWYFLFSSLASLYS